MLSLPVTSPIHNETDLFNRLPGALYVTKFVEATDRWLRWSPTGGCKVYDSLKGGNPISTVTGNGCFLVNPGEGFGVVAGRASSYTVLGADGSTTIALKDPAQSHSGNNLISLPFCPVSYVRTAKQLIDDIGVSNVASVSRYLCTNDSLQTYTGRPGYPGVNFNLKAGEAYFVRMLHSVNYTTKNTTCGVSSSNAEQTNHYNVGGTATTSTFAFRIDNGSVLPLCFDNCVPFTAIGEDAGAMAQDIVRAVNARCGPAVTALQAPGSSSFSITIHQISPQHLWVGTGAGDPIGCSNDCPVANCDVNVSGGCTFNPTISLIANLGRDSYACSDTLDIAIRDDDLAWYGTQNVTVSSPTEPAGETVTLSETPPGTGTFSGSIATSPSPPAPGDGVLSVSTGDTVTVSYHDLDDGSGQPALVTDTATVDCIGPVITDVAVTNVTGNSADVVWSTNETSSSRAHYSLVPPPDLTASSATLVTSHSVHVTGLSPCSTYYWGGLGGRRGLTADDHSGSCTRSGRANMNPTTRRRAFRSRSRTTTRVARLPRSTWPTQHDR